MAPAQKLIKGLSVHAHQELRENEDNQTSEININ
jgi:hypothetical protein